MTTKLNSRKFVVWLVQTLISVVVIGFCFFMVIKNPTASPDSIFKLIELAMGYFALISGIYLGVNIGQKIGLAYAPIKLDEEPEENTETEKETSK